MKCYGQIIWETGDMATPEADQYEQWQSIEEAKRALAGCHSHPYLDDQQGVTLLLWKGEPDPEALFPCDSSNHYPDRVYKLGRWGGVSEQI